MEVSLEVDYSDLSKWAEEELGAIARAVTKGARTAASRSQARLRVRTYSAFGPKVANAWRVANYPGTVRGQQRRDASYQAPVYSDRVSLYPSALIFTKAPNIIDAANKGVPIRAKNKKWLAVPTEEVPLGKRGGRLEPREFQERSGLKLVFIQGKHAGQAFLILPHESLSSGRARGKLGLGIRYTAAYRQGGAGPPLIMYRLYRQVRSRKVLDLASEANQLSNEASQIISAALGTEP